MKLLFILFLLMSAIIISGCAEDVAIKQVQKGLHTDTNRCAVRSGEYCIKYEKVLASNWKAIKYQDGYVVKAQALDYSKPIGHRSMEGIWYVEGEKVYCVEQTGSIAMCKEGRVSDNMAEDILNKYGSRELIADFNKRIEYSSDQLN